MYQNVILTQTEHQQQCTLFLSVFLVYVLRKYSTTAISSCVCYAAPLWTLQFSILFTKKFSFSRWPLFGSRQDVLFKAFYLRQASITTAKVCKIAFATHLLVMCVLIFWWKSSDNHNENRDPTSWGVNLVVAGAQHRSVFQLSNLTFRRCQIIEMWNKRAHHFVQ